MLDVTVGLVFLSRDSLPEIVDFITDFVFSLVDCFVLSVLSMLTTPISGKSQLLSE